MGTPSPIKHSRLQFTIIYYYSTLIQKKGPHRKDRANKITMH